MPGWKIRMINEQGTVVNETYTDEDGYYKFDINNDFYGKFRIEEVLQAGWEQTLPSLGYYEVNLGPKSLEWSVDGIVYSDEYIYLKRLHCGGSGTVSVKVYGTHTGEYYLTSEASLHSIDYPGLVNLHSDEVSAKITVVDKNGNPDSLDFGNRPEEEYPEGMISGHKFKDSNRNKVWDSSEAGLSNWIIRLYSIDSSTSDDTGAEPDSESATLVAETLTDSSGYYEFTGLEWGQYRVEEVQKSGWTQTAPDTGCYDVFISPNQTSVEDLDFGNYRPSSSSDDYGSISGHKFNDLNGNGEWDNDEPALSGWTIELSNGDTDITDADGYYSFTRLPYGTYTVTEVQQEGWNQTAPESFSFTVDVNANNENHTDLDFGNEEEEEIIIPPSGGPEPTPVEPLEVIVTPKRVPAGDPTIRVTPGPDTTAVYALLPDGRKLDLKQGKDGVWKVSFMVAFETADGPYPIEVYAVDKSGLTRQNTYTITIDNSLPLMEIKKTAQTDGNYLLEIKPLFNAVAIDYSVGGNSVKLSRTQKGRWSAVVPAGDGSIKAIDESGYQVDQALLLPVIPAAAIEAVSAESSETLTAVKNTVVNPETVENAAIKNSLYLWAAAIVALLLAAAVAIPVRLRSKAK
ncbi:MSCRAMM family protein [Phosphitispora sp. TUW77]|uniref:MSCRAMM family protein n=1 Tax=Phosphitispora sp. TUW77 TaxID=3152361 RepID=UPI003AB8FCCA